MHKQIKKLLLINSFFLLGANLFAPLYALYVQQIDAHIVNVGAIWGVYILSVGLFVLFIRKFENNLKKTSKYLILGFFLRALGWVGYLFAARLWHLYVIQIVLALGEAFGTPAYRSLFSNYLDKGQYSSEWGLDIFFTCIITSIAAFAGGLIVQYYNFKTLFVIMICFSLLSVFLALQYTSVLSDKA
ncbi:MAG: MFS transporter [archaeon]